MNFFRSLYLQRRLFLILAAIVVAFILGHFAPAFRVAAQVALWATAALLVLDVLLLWRVRRGVEARRETPDRLSNGDDNDLRIHLRNHYRFPLHATVLDELPFQFQMRDAAYRVRIPSGEVKTVAYAVRPVRRGVYSFGALNVYAATPLGLARRRFRFDEGREVPVYPSYLQMRKYEFLAGTNRLDEVGVKKLRRLGHTMEFDAIREYVRGDDPRTVNWKATARRGSIMVNQYRDERAQPVYALLDTGRVMQIPFEGMTLLDYSINAALVLLNTALFKGDRAGLVNFSHEIGATLPAGRRGGQIGRILETLYALETDFLETDYARLHAHLRQSLSRRSLLLFFTNFETRSSMRRQLPYLRALARQHVVVAVFFENTLLRDLLDDSPKDTEGIYVKATAEQFALEKREIVKELSRHGIQSILTSPEDLSVQTINKYLELKARGLV